LAIEAGPRIKETITLCAVRFFIFNVHLMYFILKEEILWWCKQSGFEIIKMEKEKKRNY